MTKLTAPTTRLADVVAVDPAMTVDVAVNLGVVFHLTVRDPVMATGVPVAPPHLW